jgi:DnaD/phage-associated family protein
MASTYWIKLYHEILDDPKMATLPDRLWRRVIELFLLAGKLNHNGNLPDARQIAWMLRVSTDDIMADMEQLENTGIIEPIPNGWVIVKFAARQAAIPSSERMAAMRDKRKHDQYYEPGGISDVTDELRKVTQITDTETEFISSSINGDESNFQKVLKLYETYIGPIAGAFVGEQIDEALKEHPFEWFEAAFRIAVANNVRTWAYVKGILKNWKDHGFMADNRPVKSQGRGTFPRSGNGRHGLPPPPEGYEYDSSPAARPGTLIERQPRVHEVYTLEQVNEIRANVGKPPFTKEEYLNA